MPIRNMQLGIQSIQAGHIEEGARLLRIALNSNQLTNKMRAIAYLWLAVTSDDRNFRIQCYNDAINADPTNEQAHDELAKLLSPTADDTSAYRPIQSPPPNHDTGAFPRVGDTGAMRPTVPPATWGDTGAMRPLNPQAQDNYPPATWGETGAFQRMTDPGTLTPPSGTGAFRPVTGQQGYAPGNSAAPATVGIVGPNGLGTGFFVTRDGLVATSRFVVGGEESVVVQFERGREMSAAVVRAFGEYDLAFVFLNMPVSTLPVPSPLQYVPDNVRLRALAHNRETMHGVRRATTNAAPEHWFPTNLTSVIDAGGNPIFDDNNYLIGMLSRNASRTSGYVYGLHVSKVFESLEKYFQELRTSSHRAYCPGCGYASRAIEVGAFYCEVCGCVLPFAANTQRFPQPQTANFYGENIHRPCANCQARAGFFNGACLRCGHELKQFR